MVVFTRRFLAALCLVWGAFPAIAQTFDFPPREPSPLTVRQIHSGHSLSDTYGSNPWPGRLILATSAVSNADANQTIYRSIIPGAPLFWRWDNPAGEFDARLDIDKFELLVTTEAVPLYADPEELEFWTLGHLDKWVELAGTKGNGGKGAEMMLYSTWTTYFPNSPTPPEEGTEDTLSYRERMELEGQRWEKIQDRANAVRPAGMKPVYMIPGHRLMLRLIDDIEAGRAEGLTSIGDLFHDEIHLNKAGAYAVTMLVYAAIYQRNPRELPNVLVPEEDKLSARQAAYFKKIAWEVLQSYPRAGLPQHGN
jgi:hypothetical protein